MFCEDRTHFKSVNVSALVDDHYIGLQSIYLSIYLFAKYL